MRQITWGYKVSFFMKGYSMNSIIDTIMSQLGNQEIGGIAKQLGIDEAKAGSAVSAAVPVLLGALARNSSNEAGASSLDKALEKDHDGGILEDVMGFISNAEAGPGEGILKHVLGGKRERVETGIGASTGLDTVSVGKLMATLAPLVMGTLGKQKRSSGLDATGLASLLNNERKEVERREPQGFNILNSLLDSDGDGDVDAGDIAKRGFGLLGGLLGKK